ncbi:MAG: hypothetical protein R6W91_02950, partial [Thermoplasmata archaeon]
MGKKGFIKKKIDLATVPIDTPEQRASFINACVGTTECHSLMQRRAMGAAASIDRADLKPGKMAIIGFNGTWSYYDKARWSGQLKLLMSMVDLLADATHAHLSQIPGMTVIPFSEVVNSEAYKNLKYKEKAQGRLRGDFIATARGLKDFFSSFTLDFLGQMKDLGTALGVDYVVTVRVEIFLDKGISGSVFTPYIYETNIDVFSAHESKEVWSFVTPKSFSFPMNMLAANGFIENMGVLVPTKIEIKETGDLANAMFGYRKFEADFGDLGIHIPVTYDKIAMTMAQKFR